MLLVYTLAQALEKERYVHVSRLFELVNAGKIKAITSFYALHELLLTLKLAQIRKRSIE
ncbi:MAG: hypothetical protein Q8O41_08205 [Candidatus Methanoperedens sp.]|nr:hypothetical protein [Candidatus Methanoperedens sp.]